MNRRASSYSRSFGPLVLALSNARSASTSDYLLYFLPKSIFPLPYPFHRLMGCCGSTATNALSSDLPVEVESALARPVEVDNPPPSGVSEPSATLSRPRSQTPSFHPPTHHGPETSSSTRTRTYSAPKRPQLPTKPSLSPDHRTGV